MSSVKPIPARQPRSDTSRTGEENFKLDVTDLDLLIPISKETMVNQRHSVDLREPQPTPSDSQTASLQSDSPQTTTSKSSCSLPTLPSTDMNSFQESTSSSGSETSLSKATSDIFKDRFQCFKP